VLREGEEWPLLQCTYVQGDRHSSVREKKPGEGQKIDISVAFPVSNTHYLCKTETLIFETSL
jgi:hypothetical protein